MFLLNIFIFYISNYFFCKSKSKSESKIKINLYGGYDERFLTENITNKYAIYNSEIDKIKINYKKKWLLDKLVDDKISIFEKLHLIEDNSIKPPNITAGGLKHNIFKKIIHCNR